MDVVKVVKRNIQGSTCLVAIDTRDNSIFGLYRYVKYIDIDSWDYVYKCDSFGGEAESLEELKSWVKRFAEKQIQILRRIEQNKIGEAKTSPTADVLLPTLPQA